MRPPVSPLPGHPRGAGCLQLAGNNAAWGRGRARFGVAAAVVAERAGGFAAVILLGWVREPSRWRGSEGGESHAGAWGVSGGECRQSGELSPGMRGAVEGLLGCGWVGAACGACACGCSCSILRRQFGLCFILFALALPLLAAESSPSRVTRFQKP